MTALGFAGGSVIENPPANVGDVRDMGLIPGSGRFPGGGDGTPLQYLVWTEKPVGVVHRAAKSWT